jgi:hypothetical protein
MPKKNARIFAHERKRMTRPSKVKDIQLGYLSLSLKYQQEFLKYVYKSKEITNASIIASSDNNNNNNNNSNPSS